MYVRKTVLAGNTIEIKKYHSYFCLEKGAKRNPKKKDTPEKQIKVNLRHAEERLRWLMNANFRRGDSLVTTSFNSENRPQDSAEMQQYVKKFLERLRKEFKKQGKELKYVYVKERGKRSALHIHILMSQVDADTLRKCWTFGMFKLETVVTDECSGIASYFIKYSAKTEEVEGELVGKRWNPSKNLVKPTIKTERIMASTFREEPTCKKGYYIHKELTKSGISEVTGYEYISYQLVKLERGQPPGRGTG